MSSREVPSHDVAFRDYRAATLADALRELADHVESHGCWAHAMHAFSSVEVLDHVDEPIVVRAILQGPRSEA